MWKQNMRRICTPAASLFKPQPATMPLNILNYDLPTVVRYGRPFGSLSPNSGRGGTLAKAPSVFDRRRFHFYTQEPFHPIPNKEPSEMSVDEAVTIIKSGYKVFVHGTSSTPFDLLEALMRHGKQAMLRDIELIHILVEGEAEWNNPEYEGIFRSNNLFIGQNCRGAVNAGRADYMPINLSDIPLLFRRKIINLDVAMIQVAPPDEHGFCSLGGSIDCTRAAVQNAEYIIGLVNPNMPRTFGDGLIHKSHLDAMCHTNRSLPETPFHQPTAIETKIGQTIADSLVEDGATLQMGIGNIPSVLQRHLQNHKDLGIHTEMFSDGLVDLCESGVITNALKIIKPGKIVGSFCLGTRRLYEFLDNNPGVEMCDNSYVNNAAIISKNPKVTAINSCIEVDLTGQVVADSIGEVFYSGVGGQIDFLRGAALSQDGKGKPILAMPSVTKSGKPRIVSTIKQGAGVVTTRAHVHYLVTEYGIAYLFGKNIRQRAYELIRISHPDHREELEKEAYKRIKCMPSPD